MPESPEAKPLDLIRAAVRTFRHAPREQIYVLLSGAALSAARLLLEAPKILPEWATSAWKALPPILSILGGLFFVVAFVRVWRTVTAPLPDAGVPKPAAIKGASSFGPQDGELFLRLGRERELSHLRGWIEDPKAPLVVVMGESTGRGPLRQTPDARRR